MESIAQVHDRIAKHIHRTPVHTSSWLNKELGCEVFFKCENFQRMGAFKMRGALNAISKLNASQQQKGVVTHSSGNFAQALALAASQLGVKAHIVMPSNAPQVKQDAVLGYGGVIYLCEPTNEAREQMANEIAVSKGATFIHPSNDLDVIQGQATATLELIEDISDLDAIFVPVGGGGLLAGAVLANRETGGKAKIIGAEPIEVNDAYRSLKANEIVFNHSLNTVADGLKTHLGHINFPIIQEGVHEICCVEEQEIITALRIVLERMKLVVEPSAAVGLAALTRLKTQFQNQRVGVLLSGGNVDLAQLKQWF